MKILIDTNILIDYLVERELYYENARRILLACRDGRVHAGIASHSISNIFYILRREIPEEDRRIALKALCTITEVIGIDKEKLMQALDNADFRDMEDCLQAECAAAFGASYIVTRNVKDFAESPVRAITPEEFLQL